ncbi:MAG: chitobiase/beta-hexosaminidase C-terminal domain-containing protein [Deltaproteobacteria bacterium]|nr:chitobiase/beta-hexosaminidase C-terminal domain-containing protein [Deltaproteobacteria bacterium]
MRAIAIALLALLAPGCGGKVECGEGTFRDGDNCIGFDPDDEAPPVVTLTPPAQRSREPIPTAVALTTDELSQLYVTTDGSDPDPTAGPGEPSPVTIVEITNGMTLKYLAIDRAGNQSAIESATYISDVTGPGKVKDLVVTPAGSDVTITWTNPIDQDFAGTVVARVVDVIDASPESGQTYTAATDLTPSLQILQVGSGTQFIDTARPPGRVRYAVWAFDDLTNYGPPSAARSEIALGNLEIEFQFDVPNNALTVVTPSVAFDTTGTTAQFSAGTLTLALQLQNISTSHFQNPKALVVSTSSASFATTNPTADGLSFVDLGPATFAPNATITRNLVFTGVSGVATFRLRLGHHASIIASRNRSRDVAFIDSGAVFLNNSVRETPKFNTLASGPNNQGKVRPALFTGEHFVDVPTTHGTIERWDMVTQTRVFGTDVGVQNGDRTNVQALLADSANIYCLTKVGKTRDTGRLTVIRLDENLRETGRLDLSAVDAQGFTHPALSPDGSTLAIPSGSSIVLVDTESMTQRDVVPGTPDLDVIQTAFLDRVRAVTFFDNGNGLFAVSRLGGKAEAIRFTDNGTTNVELSDPSGGTGRGNAVALAPDGRVFVAFDSGLRVYNPATDLLGNTSYTQAATGLVFANGKLRVLRTTRNQVDVADPSTGLIQVTNTLPFGAFGHWLVLASR